MSFLQKDPQYKLRLPADLKEKIEQSAQEKNRSMNADIVARLQDSFDVDINSLNTVLKAIEELVSKNIYSNRKAHLSNRLNLLKDQFNRIEKNLSSSVIAYKINEEYAEHVDLWFKGKLEPSFSQLRKIAQLFNCNVEWLFHGIGHPFTILEDNFPLDNSAAIEWLNKSHNLYNQPIKILLLRSKDDRGDFYIVKIYESNLFEIIFIKNIILNKMLYEDNLKNIKIFSNILKDINKNLELTSLRKKIKSFILKNNDFEELVAGNIHPLSVLNTYTPWWEDIWDEGFYHNNQYWDGWIELCDKIHEE
ncbi:Arc family DNA-binding protein [Acinetobacter sp. YH12023]|uniref:Arc family DNA-binding protein n=1 Tax=Acinetobacter sp. YH12023 TaxID=2601041 RepID=UPI0015D452D2|nr:Arc family DNA-binding protein [Acinetobacter sp. YH12023]